MVGEEKRSGGEREGGEGRIRWERVGKGEEGREESSFETKSP
jgi:hypothetical protein